MGRKKEKKKSAAEEETYSQKDLEKISIEEAFNKFDLNGNGLIGKAELGEALKMFLNLPEAPSDIQLTKIMATYDKNKDGKLDINDFFAMLSEDDEDQYLSAFTAYDIDADGYISREELSNCLKLISPKLSEGEVTRIMKRLDPEGTNSISYEKFKAFFNS